MKQPEERLPRSSRVWLVTGCSSGLGRAFVPAIVACGDKVIATARRLSDIQLLASDNVRCMQLDVTQSQHVLDGKLAEDVSFFGDIDVLVNNAGFVWSGVWEELGSEAVQQQFETNVFGAMRLSRSVLPYMRCKSSGTIIFLGSIAGWLAIAAGGLYSASKFALEGAVEALDSEISGMGIRAHIMVLGEFRTKILDPSSPKANFKTIQGIPAYRVIKQELQDAHMQTHGRQLGNPELAVQRIVDFVRMENLPPDQIDQLPVRIPIGSDAVDVMRKKCEDTLGLLDSWADFASFNFVKAAAPIIKVKENINLKSLLLGALRTSIIAPEFVAKVGPVALAPAEEVVRAYKKFLEEDLVGDRFGQGVECSQDKNTTVEKFPLGNGGASEASAVPWDGNVKDFHSETNGPELATPID
ncbi:hypothetical protein G7Z17_g9637 [Cylindrodendrum hubeiense]|uniref:NAD(P)-binding protein n=1 Tax=Cylindrodendrum hubeiense TaxID=595255 RepID=A0A9P5LC03_9HYPO|nr:hypothetical protein G7Z17_g9637 [Cylindrodendrum hubeiense]